MRRDRRTPQLVPAMTRAVPASTITAPAMSRNTQSRYPTSSMSRAEASHVTPPTADQAGAPTWVRVRSRFHWPEVVGR